MITPTAHLRRASSSRATLLMIIAIVAPKASIAQAIISASSDVTIDLGSGIIASDEDILVDDQVSTVMIEDLAPFLVQET